jgi:hypothetical protein
MIKYAYRYTRHIIELILKGYPKSKVELAAYQIHEFDPCRVMWLATARELVDVTRL